MQNYAAWTGCFYVLLHNDEGPPRLAFLKKELLRQFDQGWPEPDWDAAKRQRAEYEEAGGVIQ